MTLFRREGPPMKWLPIPEAIYRTDFGSAVAVGERLMVVGANRDYEEGQFSGSFYIFSFEDQQWKRSVKLVGSDTAADDELGTSVALFGNRTVIGAPQHDPGGVEDAGAAYVFYFDGRTWKETAKLIAQEPQAGARFGDTVTTFGDWVAVGAPDGDAVYLFERDGTIWNQIQQLTGEGLGSCLVMSADTLLAGSTSEHDGRGAVHVFELQGAEWVEAAVLQGDQGELSEDFGISCVLAGDSVLVGAPLKDISDVARAGAVYIFARDGDGYGTPSLLTEPRLIDDGQFGLQLATWGNRLAVSGNSRSALGRFHIFDEVDGQWQLLGRYTGTGFGSSVAVTEKHVISGAASFSQQGGLDKGLCLTVQLGDVEPLPDLTIHENQVLELPDVMDLAMEGHRALLAAEPNDVLTLHALEYDPAGDSWNEEQTLAPVLETGSIYNPHVAMSGDTALMGGTAEVLVLRYETATGSWSEVQRIAPTGLESSYGLTVEIRGELMLIGNPDDDQIAWDAGYAWVYGYDADTDSWTESQQLVPADTDEHDAFGSAMAIADGILFISSAADENFDFCSGGVSGSVYVFTLDEASSEWQEKQKLIPSESCILAGLGGNLAVEGTQLVAGAPGGGAVYHFNLDPDSGQWQKTGFYMPYWQGQDDGPTQLGKGLCMSAGRTLAGAPNFNYPDQSNRDNGAAFLLSLDDELGSLVLNNIILAADHSSPYAYFGYALDCTDSQALISAFGTDRVYYFSLNRDK
jgi:hypothetical protein